MLNTEVYLDGRVYLGRCDELVDGWSEKRNQSRMPLHGQESGKAAIHDVSEVKSRAD